MTKRRRSGFHFAARGGPIRACRLARPARRDLHLLDFGDLRIAGLEGGPWAAVNHFGDLQQQE